MEDHLQTEKLFFVRSLALKLKIFFQIPQYFKYLDSFDRYLFCFPSFSGKVCTDDLNFTFMQYKLVTVQIRSVRRVCSHRLMLNH